MQIAGKTLLKCVLVEAEKPLDSGSALPDMYPPFRACFTSHKPLPIYPPPSFPFPKSRISLTSCSSGFPQIYAQMTLLVFPSPCGPGCGSARANTGPPLLSSLWLGYPFLEALMTKQTVQRGEGNAPCVPNHITLSTSEMPWYSTKCSMTSRDCGY